MKRKGLLSVVLILGLMISPSPSWAYREFVDNGAGCTESVYENGEISYTLSLPITIHVDGKYVPTDVDPTIRNGRTMVPLRAAGEALSATISWNQTTKTASASKDRRTVQFILNSSTYYINGQAYYTDVVPTIINGRTLLPIRVFAEALNTDVNWDQNLYDVDIDTPAMDAKEPTIPENATQETQKFIKKYYVATDPSDPLVGSWRNRSTSKTGSETITPDNYIFISKYNDEYHVITFSCEDSSLRRFDSLVVTRPKNGLIYDNSKGAYKMDNNLEGLSTVYYRVRIGDFLLDTVLTK